MNYNAPVVSFHNGLERPLNLDLVKFFTKSQIQLGRIAQDP